MSMRSRSNRRQRCAQRLTIPIVENLEPRLLLAVELFTDINPGAASSYAFNFANIGSTTYFAADDGVHGSEPWRTDGTVAGTRLIKDLASGPAHSFPDNFTGVGDTVFFQANALQATQLWKSDGTADGTQRLLADGTVVPLEGPMFNLNGKLLFVAQGPGGTELWKSDGTNTGTVVVKDIYPGTGSSNPKWLTIVGGSLFFVANDGVHGEEVWKSDGTAEGTAMVMDLWPGITGSQPTSLVAHGNTLLFNATDGAQGLWATDGTPAGTVLIKQNFTLNVNDPSSTIKTFAEIGGTLYFSGNDWTSGNELWKTDGTAAGTQLVKDIRIGTADSSPSWFVDVNGTLFFGASEGNGRGLWKSDGTAAGTKLVKNLQLGGGKSFLPLPFPTNVNGVLYFVGYEGSDEGFNIWKSDGTTEGTVRFASWNTGSLVNINGTLFFPGSDAEHGSELRRVVEDQKNHAPSGNDRTVQGVASRPYTLQVKDFGYVDSIDLPPNIFLAVRIAALPVGGTLNVNGAAVAIGQTISVSDISAGKLTFSAAPEATGKSVTFAFQVQDDGGTADGGADLDASPNTLTIQVLNDGNSKPNHAPDGADGQVSGPRFAGYTFAPADFGFSDPSDTPANTLAAVKISTIPDNGLNGPMLADGIPVVAGQFIPVATIAAGKLSYSVGNGYGCCFLFKFQVQDDGGTADGGVDLDPIPNTLSINIVPGPIPVPTRNLPPSGTDKTVSVNEGNTYILRDSDFGFTDPLNSPPNSLQQVFIWSLPAQGTLTNNGGPIALGTSISIIDLWSGRVRYVAPAQNSGSSQDSFTFRVQDNGGTANGGIDTDPVPKTFGFNILSTAHPHHSPQGSNRLLSILDDAAYPLKLSDFGFSDPNDSPPDQLQAVIIDTPPDQGVFTDHGVAVVAGQVIPVSDIIQNQLVFQPLGSAANDPVFYTSFNFRVVDNGGTAAGGNNTEQIGHTLSVAIFDGPSSPRGQDNTIVTAENLSYTFSAADFRFSDPHDFFPNQFAGVRITTLPVSGTLMFAGQQVVASQFIPVSSIDAGQLQFTPPPDAVGAALTAFTFQVQDDSSTEFGGSNLDSVPKTLRIDVNLLNHRPTFTKGADQSVKDNSGPHTISDWATSISPGPSSEAAQKLHFVIVSNSNPTLFASPPAIDSNGHLAFAPALGTNGSADISVALADDGGTANGGYDQSELQHFTINVALDLPWHNRDMPADVSGDGQIIAEDALDIINFINAFGSGPLETENQDDQLLPQGANALGKPTLFYDVTGDDHVAADDVLSVINYINAHTSAPSSVPPEIIDNVPPSTEDLVALLSIDLAEQKQRH